MISDCNFTTVNGQDGIVFNEDGQKKIILIDKEDLIIALCHGLSNHNVNHNGGFYGGVNSISGAGAAIGKNAKTVKGATPIDAIQLGEGNNVDEKSLQVYTWKLLDKYGMIPVDRLPDSVFTSNPLIIPFSNVLSFRAEHNLYKEVPFVIYLSTGNYVFTPRVNRQDNYIDFQFKRPKSGQIEFTP